MTYLLTVRPCVAADCGRFLAVGLERDPVNLVAFKFGDGQYRFPALLGLWLLPGEAVETCYLADNSPAEAERYNDVSLAVSGHREYADSGLSPAAPPG